MSFQTDFVFKVKADIDDMQDSIKSLEKSLEKLSLPKGMGKELSGLISRFKEEAQNFSAKSKTPINNKSDFTQLENSGKKALELFKKIETAIKSVNELGEKDKMQLISPDVVNRIKALKKSLKKYNKLTEKNAAALEKARGKVAQYQKSIESLNQEQEELNNKKHISSSEWELKIKQLRKYKRELADLDAERPALQEANQKRMEKSERSTPDKRTSEYKALAQLEEKRLSILRQIDDIESSLQGKITLDQREQKQKQLNNELQRTQTELQEQMQLVSKLESTGDSSALSNILADLKEIKGLDLSGIKTIEDLLNMLTRLTDDNISKVNSGLNEMETHLSEAAREADDLEGKLREDASAISELNNRANQIKNLQDSITQFFSLTNSVQLFKRAISSAVDTVKKLDAAMAETAVVTDFSIGDMWDKLPEYSKAADDLGVSINGAYEATTLFYQQGLKTKKAMELANETLKMSRIAGVEAAEATDMMTAALRGFNMELDKASAERVNDVYANLAAVTAADTEEIATAMTKTASIANSANMEFETTAALLSQIIETTREAPETAGTAMKTIIARFTEVKKLSGEGLLSGTDSEGEDIEINKIDAALRTVGISLKDFLNGSKGIDDIFLELAEKWDTLDLSTQRYIATTAAGSRQQSRFIAMMSDYSRTMELVDAANNSAGVSTEQMNKLAESLESKINKLKNAWDTFLMGLADNEIIKISIDLLTGLLNIINKISEVLEKIPMVGSTFATIFQVGLISAAMKGLKKLLTFGTQIIANMWTDPKNATAATAGGTRDGRLYAKAAQAEINNIEGVGGKKTNKDMTDFIEDQVEDMSDNKSSNNSKNVWERVKDNGGIKETINKHGGVKQTFKDVGTKIKGAGSKAKDGYNSVKNTWKTTKGFSGKIKGVSQVASKAGVNTAAVAAASIAGAISGAIEGYKLMEKAISKGTLTNKLKEAQKATSSAAETAKKAEENYKNLFSQKSNYESAIDNLKKLDKGTLEWRQSLMESNNAVLELLDTYPELAKYVSKGKDGELTISEDGWIAAEREKSQQMANSNAILASAKTKESQLREQKAKEDYERTLGNNWNEEQRKSVRAATGTAGGVAGGVVGAIGGIAAGTATGTAVGAALGTVVPGIGNIVGAVVGGLVGFVGGAAGAIIGVGVGELINQGQDHLKEKEEQLSEELQKRYDEGTLDNMSDEEKQELANKYGVEIDVLDETIKKLNEYKEAVEQARIEQQMYTQQMIMAGLSAKAVNSEYADDISMGIAGYASNNIVEQTDSRAKEIYKTGSDTSDDQWRKTKLDELGLDTGGSEKEQLQKIYAAQTGKTLEEVKNDETLDEKTLANAIAAVDLGEEVQEGAEAVIEAIEDMDKHTAKNISGLLSDNGANMTKDILDQVSNGDMSNEEILNLLTSNGINKDDLKKSLGLTLGEDTDDELYEILQQQIEAGVKTYNDTLSSLDGKKSSTGKELSTEAYNAYSQYASLTNGSVTNSQMKDIYSLIEDISTMGGDASSTWDLLGENVLKTAQAFGVEEEALDIIVATDFSSVESIEILKESLQSLGISIEDKLVDEIIDASNALKTFDMEEFKNEINSLIKTADELSESDDKKISQETYKLLIETETASESDFIARGDEYYYLGDSMQELVEAIEKNTSVLLKKEKQDINERYAIANRFHSAYENDQTFTGPDGKTENLEAIHQKIMSDSYKKEDINNLKGEGGLLEMLFPELKEEWQYLEGQDLIKYYKEKIVPNYIQNFSQLEEQNKIFEDQVAASQYTQIRNGHDLLNERTETQKEQEYKEGAFNLLIDDTEGASAALTQLVNEFGESSDLIKAHAVDVSKDSKELKEFKDVISDNIDMLDSRNIGTQEYNEAVEAILNELPPKLKDMIGTDFIANNQEWLRAIANYGQGDTLEEINASIIAGEAAIRDFHTAMLAKYVPTDAAKIISGIYSSLSVGETKSIDKQITELMSLNYSIDEIKNWLEMGGITATIDEKTLTGLATLSSGWRSASDYYAAEMEEAEFLDEKEQTENPFDWLYNLIQDMEVQAKRTTKLEEEYNQMLENRNATAQEISYNLGQQLAQSYVNKELNNKMIESRQAEIDDIFAENQDLVQTGGFEYDKENNALYLDRDAIEEFKKNATTKEDLETIERITEFESKVKDKMGDIDDSIDAIDDEDSKIIGMVADMVDKTVSFYDTIFNTVKEHYQNVIDEQSELNDTIDESNNRLISSMRDIVDKYRQDRENAEKEEDIGEMERRLAYLRQDTSGANKQTILDLEDELKDKKQDYTDTLIDQKIDELEEQNNYAAEQREKQIEIMQFQLDEAARNGELMNHAIQLFQTSVGEDGSVSPDSGFGKMYYEVEGLAGQSRLAQMDKFAELNNDFRTAAAFEGLINFTGNEQGGFSPYMEQFREALLGYLGIDGEGGLGNLISTDIGTLGEGIDSTIIGESGKSLYESIEEQIKNGISNISGGGEDTTEGGTLQEIYSRIPDITNLESAIYSQAGSYVEALKNEIAAYNGTWEDIYNTLINKEDENEGYTHSSNRGSRIDYYNTYNPTQKLGADLSVGDVINGHTVTRGFIYHENGLGSIELDNNTGMIVEENKWYSVYKTGGLADYTGPAWLDGTPTKPELVLNAADTQNFIALKNILADIMNGNHFSNENNSNGQLDKLVEQSEVAKNQRDTQIGLLSSILAQESGSDANTEEAIRAVEQHMVSIALQQGIVL